MQTYGVVIGFEYRACPRMEFPDIVEEFDLSFQLADAQTRALTWDCDDIAVIDRDYLRVALGWLPPDEDGGAWHLVAAVGPCETAAGCLLDDNSLTFLVDQIIARTQNVLPADAVLQGPASGPVGPELVDDIFDLLRLTATAACDTVAKPDIAGAASNVIPDGQAAQGFVPSPDDANTIDIATKAPPWQAVAGWLSKRADPSKPLRLTVHTLALTLMLYVPPLGASLFTYTMLRDIVPVSA